MLFKVFAVAGWVALCTVSGVQAQTLPGPAEVPPSGFKGQQYVDSRGCVFLRAGLGGRVNWVARITAGRKPLCGYPPSGGRVEVASAAETAPKASSVPVAKAAPVRIAPPPAAGYVSPGPQATGRPVQTIASLKTPPAIRYEASRVAVPAPRHVPQTVVVPRTVANGPAVAAQVHTVTAQRLPGCPDGAPYGFRATLGDGRVSLFCSPDPAIDPSYIQRRASVSRQASAVPGYAVLGAEASRSASYDARGGYTPARRSDVAAISGYGCPRTAPYARRFTIQGGGTTVMCTGVDGSAVSLTPQIAGERMVSAVPQMPKGYKPAWRDDRLNPRRGIGSHAGQAAQDEIWTREHPARLHTDKVKRKKHVVVVTSASNAPHKAVAPGRVTGAVAGRYFVQVGTFGVPANARATASRLSGMGLPVAASRVSRGGKPLQIVMAGPFGDAAQAKAALSTARRAGFGDAFIR